MSEEFFTQQLNTTVWCLKYTVVRRNFAIENANKRFTVISFFSQLDVKSKSFNYSWCLAEMEKLLPLGKWAMIKINLTIN